MIVELTGPPGVGKSTCAEWLIRELQRRGVDTVSHLALVRSFLDARYLTRHRPIYWLLRPRTRLLTATVRAAYLRGRVSHGVSRSRLPPRAREAGYWLSEAMLLERHYVQRFPDPPRPFFVTTGGIVHRSVSLRVWGGEAAARLNRDWYRVFPRGAVLLVRLAAPLETVLERLWSRGLPSGWPEGADSRERAGAVVQRFEDATSASVAEFQAAGGEVLELAADVRPERMAPRIEGCVAALLARSGRPEMRASAAPRGRTA